MLELTISERLLLFNCLPQRGGRIKMILVNDLAKQIEFSPAEIADYNIQELENGLISWKTNNGQLKSVTYTAEQIPILKECIDEADRREWLQRDHLSLIETIDSL